MLVTKTKQISTSKANAKKIEDDFIATYLQYL